MLFSAGVREGVALRKKKNGTAIAEQNAIAVAAKAASDDRPSCEKNKNVAAVAEQKAAAVAAASFGLRLDQRQARTGGDTRRAMIGRPSSQRSRSTANSPAVR